MIIAFVNIYHFFSQARWFLVPSLLILGSCNITKQVEKNQLLLVKNKVEVVGPLKKEIHKALPDNYKQRPNERFLGIARLKLFFFNLGSGGKKDNGLKRFLRDKLGEPPVLVDTVYIESTARSIKNYLRTKGHYYSEVSYAVIPKKSNPKKGTVIYMVHPGDYYRFNQYEINIADRDIYDLVKPTMSNSFITIGYRLDHENVLREQERIVNLLRNNGYYSFSKEYVEFDTDTSLGNMQIYFAMTIKNRSEYETHKKYYINDITIEIDKGTEGADNRARDTIPFRNFNYMPHRYQLNPEILDHNLFLRRGELFRQPNFTRSYGRLSDLNIFKFINISPRVNDTGEVGKIDYNVKLVPNIKYNYILEPQLITSDQNNTLTSTRFQSYGVAATAQFSNRNVFKNAEILQVSFRTSFEAQGKLTGGRIFNATEQSLGASITVPHILFIPSLDRNINFVNTKTSITASAIYELNIDYERRVATTGLTYQLNKKLVSFYVSPVEFNYIHTTLKSADLVRRAERDVFLQTLFSNNVIMDTRLGFTYSNKAVAKNNRYYTIKWDVLEYAGNTLTYMNQILNQERSSDNRFKLFGVNYFQYAKSAIDFRHTSTIDVNNSLVYRIFGGVVVPYGNSPEYTPFEKRFFVGGANSLRAWSPRSIGPGSYKADNQIDHSGDVKIELNGEYRFNMYNQWLEGAIFSDIGNIWALRGRLDRPGAEFTSSRFYKELAADVGYGVRLNFTIVLIRFDLGLPVYDPTFSEGNRFVIRDFNGTWLADNLFFNFGIGYPF